MSPFASHTPAEEAAPMKVTLTQALGPHKKGSTHEVTPAVADRLIGRGAAKKAEIKPKGDAGKGKTDSGDDDGDKASDNRP